jgi:hypothetical protein
VDEGEHESASNLCRGISRKNCDDQGYLSLKNSAKISFKPTFFIKFSNKIIHDYKKYF